MSEMSQDSRSLKGRGRLAQLTAWFVSRPLFVALLVFSCTLTLALSLLCRLEEYRLQVEKDRVAELAEDHLTEIRHQLDHAFSATSALAAMIHQGEGAIANFDALAKQMLPFYPGVAALQLAPGGVISATVPYEGNERALGHDLFRDPRRSQEAIRCRDSGKLCLTGPVELLQGGMGAVARLPVYLEKGGAAPEFWGFTIALLRFPKVIEKTNLALLPRRGFAYELWRINPDNNEKHVIAASSSPPLTEPVDRFLSVPNTTWTLSVEPLQGWGNPVALTIKAAIALIFSLLLAWLAKLLIEAKAYGDGLESLVAARTVELEANAEALEVELERRNRAEIFLKIQQQITETLIENSPTMIFVLDPQHRVVLWNRSCEEMTGVSAEMVIGTDGHWQAFYDHKRFCLADLILNNDFEQLSTLYPTHTRSIRFENGVHAEGWFRNLHGTDRYLKFDAAPVYDNSGKLIAAVETVQEITDEKRVAKSLQLQSAALNAAANAIVITDFNGTIEWINPAFSILTGYSSEEAIGKNFRALVKSGVHQEDVYREIWSTLLAGKVWRGELMNRHKDGTFYPEGQTITPVRNASGAISHFVAIKRDLTEQRKLEEQLQVAQKMESVGLLAGGVAHDFNNILTTIIGYGSLALLKMTQDDPYRDYVQHMLEASDRAAHLTQDLLLFSRKKEIDKKPLELNIVLTKVEKFLKRVIGEDIDFHITSLNSRLPVLADDYQLEQVLMNLATNARDSMPEGGTLSVTAAEVLLSEELLTSQPSARQGAYAMISMSDTGCGIEEERRQRIFEPFFTTKDVGKGTGLGLAVAYGIIQQHDGFITVHSEVGRGTTFRIYLPLITEKVVEERPPQEEIIVGGTETILVAEDDKHVREITRSVLSDFGYTIIEASDGADAVNKFREYDKNIDLLLFDLIMPKMNGKVALDEIRKIQPEIKAIFSSGYAPETMQAKASIAENVYLITKPVLPSDLLRKVRLVLDGDSVNKEG